MPLSHRPPRAYNGPLSMLPFPSRLWGLLSVLCSIVDGFQLPTASVIVTALPAGGKICHTRTLSMPSLTTRDHRGVALSLPLLLVPLNLVNRS